MKALSLLIIATTGAVLLDGDSQRNQTLGALFVSGALFRALDLNTTGG